MLNAAAMYVRRGGHSYRNFARPIAFISAQYSRAKPRAIYKITKSNTAVLYDESGGILSSICLNLAALCRDMCNFDGGREGGSSYTINCG